MYAQLQQILDMIVANKHHIAGALILSAVIILIVKILVPMFREPFADVDAVIAAGKEEVDKKNQDAVVLNDAVKAVVMPENVQTLPVESPLVPELIAKADNLQVQLEDKAMEAKKIADKIEKVKQLVPAELVVAPVVAPEVLVPQNPNMTIVPQVAGPFVPIVAPVPAVIAAPPAVAPAANVFEEKPIIPVVPVVAPAPIPEAPVKVEPELPDNVLPAGVAPGGQQMHHSWSPIQWDLPIAVDKRQINPSNVLAPLQ
jgi:hypothetical protein